MQHNVRPLKKQKRNAMSPENYIQPVYLKVDF